MAANPSAPASGASRYRRALCRQALPVLVEAGAEAVLLFGSVARGQAVRGSDIDLILISSERISARELKEKHPWLARHFGFAFLRWKELEPAETRIWLLLRQAQTDARMLYDPQSRLARLMNQMPTPSDWVLVQEVEACHDRISEPQDMRSWHEMGLSARRLASLYRWVKVAVFYDNARAGVFASKREDAFEAWMRRRPEGRKDLREVLKAWPWYAQEMGRATAPTKLPGLRQMESRCAAAHRVIDLCASALPVSEEKDRLESLA